MSETTDYRECPLWYVWFYHLYWPAWIGGTILIVCSWANLVSPTIGWVGFGVACAAAVGSYVLPTVAGLTKNEDYVALNSRQLAERGDVYLDAMTRFKNGATLGYDSVAFGFRSDSEIACGAVASSSNIDETEAIDIATHATDVFDLLVERCPEFASVVKDRSLRISIMSSFDPDAEEICQVVDGKFDWNP